MSTRGTLTLTPEGASEVIARKTERIAELECEVQALKQEVARLKGKACDHTGEWTHHYDETSTLGDYYTCTECGELTQVG